LEKRVEQVLSGSEGVRGGGKGGTNKKIDLEKKERDA
jgi:hypothetical protein